MVHYYPLNHSIRLMLLILAALALALFLPFIAHSQDRDRDDRRVSCTSDGGRVFCDADTRDGARLVRQYRDSAACIEGTTWGYTERAIWVDRGCAGEFVLLAGPQAFTRIEPGTNITVRTFQRIDSDRRDDRVYTAAVAEDVRGVDGRLAIPRDSRVELLVREAPDHDLVLDLESVTVGGRRYALETETERFESQRGPGLGRNGNTAEHVGGGAVLGAIIGAIAGGGKGAAIGAGAGAAAGAGVEVITRGRSVHVPAESLLTFRVEQPLIVGVPDRGVDHDGFHYHESYGR
jgi:DUF3011 family protein